MAFSKFYLYFLTIFFAFFCQAIALEKVSNIPVRTAAINATNFDAINEVLGLIYSRNKEDFDESKMIDGAIDGIMQAVDPDCAYYPPSAYKLFNAMTDGSFYGIGVELSKNGSYPVVMGVVDGSPAKKSGLALGDRILTINNVSTANMSLLEASNQIRGSVGSTVKLKMERALTGDVYEAAITRDQQSINSIEANWRGFVLFIKISHFNQETYTDLLNQIKKQTQLRLNSPLKIAGIVLDLRGNPGGLLDQAVNIASLFLASYKKIVTIKSGSKKIAEFVSSNIGSPAYAYLKTANMAVLMDGNSASAAEVLIGALKDNDRAILIGERSFGKGSTQEVIPLTSIEGAAIKITFAHYITPKGNPVHGIGISPDLQIIKQDPASSANIEEVEKNHSLEIGKNGEMLISSISTLLQNKLKYEAIIAARERDNKKPETETENIDG